MAIKEAHDSVPGMRWNDERLKIQKHQVLQRGQNNWKRDGEILDAAWSDLYRMVHDKTVGTETIVQYIRARPHEVGAPVANGDTPFRLALRTGCGVEMVRAMLKVAPDASKEKGHPTPFMEALCPEQIIQVDPKVIETLIHNRPEAIRNPRVLGYLCSHGNPATTSLDLVKLLVSHCPNAVQTVGTRNMLPLHCACESGMSAGIVRYLLNLFPGACSTECEPCLAPGPDSDSSNLPIAARLPVELSCVSKFPNLEVIKLLVERQTFTFSNVIDYGKLLILVARSMKNTYFMNRKGNVHRPHYKEIFEYLLPRTNVHERRRALQVLIADSAWDDVHSFECVKLICDCTTVIGTNILHDAVERGLVEIATYLCDVYPFLTGQKDDAGCLPLHIASVPRASHTDHNHAPPLSLNDTQRRKMVLQRILVARNPWALMVRNREGKIPNEMAGRQASSGKIARAIFKEEDFLEFCTKKRAWLQDQATINNAVSREREKSQTVARKRYSYSIWFHELMRVGSFLSCRKESRQERARKRVTYLEELLESTILTYGQL